MTVYALPPEPEGPIWLGSHPDLGPGPHEMRKYHGGWGFVTAPDVERFTWSAVLAMGEVHDRHPRLPHYNPLPWAVDQYGHVVDEQWRLVCEGDGEGLAEFIVEAANAHAERITNGQTS
jgi:hypothetical protein